MRYKFFSGSFNALVVKRCDKKGVSNCEHIQVLEEVNNTQILENLIPSFRCAIICNELYVDVVHHRVEIVEQMPEYHEVDSDQ